MLREQLLRVVGKLDGWGPGNHTRRTTWSVTYLEFQLRFAKYGCMINIVS